MIFSMVFSLATEVHSDGEIIKRVRPMKATHPFQDYGR